jgi:hypothetical protein
MSLLMTGQGVMIMMSLHGGRAGSSWALNSESTFHIYPRRD